MVITIYTIRNSFTSYIFNNSAMFRLMCAHTSLESFNTSFVLRFSKLNMINQ